MCVYPPFSVHYQLKGDCMSMCVGGYVCVSMCVFILKVPGLVFLIKTDTVSVPIKITHIYLLYLTNKHMSKIKNTLDRQNFVARTEVSLTVTSFVQSFGFRTSAR